MKTQKASLLVLLVLSISLFTGQAQTKQSLQTVFTGMNTEQLKLAKENKFTKPDVLALEKVMAATGNQLLEFIKESAGVAPQSLIDKIESEFKSLNAEYAKILSGASLTAWKELSNSTKNTLVKRLQSDYFGASKLARTDILTDLKNGILSSLIKGFGGEDWG
jgi:hypothetical protein